MADDDRRRRALHDVPSAMTVVIDTPEAMARDAAGLADAPVLKIKVDANDPAAQIRAVRAAAPKAELIVDPNESWDRPLLEAMQPVLVEARVGLLEQPVPAGADEWLEDFSLRGSDLRRRIRPRRGRSRDRRAPLPGGERQARQGRRAHRRARACPGRAGARARPDDRLHGQLVAVDRAGAARRHDVGFRRP